MTEILLIIAVLFVGLALYVNSRPSVFTCSRSITIDAPAAEIYPHMSSPRAFNEWSPFAQMDPEAKMTYDGPAEGVGAINEWDGKKTGAGRMTITDVTPPTQVLLDLEFYKPMRANNKVEFLIVPDGQSSRVSWTMSGPVDFMGKAMGLFMDCDKMCGVSFLQGLHNLKVLVEKR